MATRLDRMTVVETALRLLNETGLEGLTLRKIATELDVKAPALYWHFDSKQALLDEMATEIFRGMTRRAPGSDDESGHRIGWQRWLGESMRLLRATLLGYRDGAKVFSGTRFTGDSHFGELERFLRVMVDAGFTPRAAARAWFTAYSYTIGFVIEEQAVYPSPDERDPGYDIEKRTERISVEYPLAAEIGEEVFADYESGFEAGLRAVMAGIEVTLGPRSQSSARA